MRICSVNIIIGKVFTRIVLKLNPSLYFLQPSYLADFNLKNYLVSLLKQIEQAVSTVHASAMK